MKKKFRKILGILCCLTFSTGGLKADNITQEIQQHLKDQGFYYGQVDGNGGSETSAAIRRYQIRYGLKVTGTLTDETRRSLGISSQSQSQSSYSSSNSSSQSPVENGYTGSARSESQVRPYAQPQYPNEEEGADQSEDEAVQPVAPSQPEDEGPRYPQYGRSYGSLFAGTVYEGAPAPVRQKVLYTLQARLRRFGFYRGPVNGHPDPSINDAIARYQSSEGMMVSGRLDNETLGALEALPGQSYGPPRTTNNPEPFPQKIYRGIWLR